MKTYLFKIAHNIARKDSFARFSTNNDKLMLCEKTILHLEAHFPGLEHVTQFNDTSYAESLIVDFQHNELGDCTDEFSFIQKGTNIILQEPWGDTLSPDFAHLFYGAARLAWLNNNIFPVHSSCFGNDKEGYILVVGPAGIGKTSTLLHSLIQYNQKVCSGDKTLVQIESDGTMTAIAGTKILTIRGEDYYRWPSLHSQMKQYGDRYIIKLNPAHIESRPVKIKMVITLNIAVNSEKIIQLSPLSALHTLFPYFLDFERADILLGGRSKVAIFDGSINNELKEELAESLESALKKIPTFHLSAPRSEIPKIINNLLMEREPIPLL